MSEPSELKCQTIALKNQLQIKKFQLEPPKRRASLLNLPWVRFFFVNRWPQFLARAITLAGIAFAILAGLFGSPVGSHNFAIIFIWIAWWSLLKLVLIPFGGRSWCSICPIPMPGEWLQRGLIPPLTSRARQRGLGIRWPKRLSGSWLQSTGFLLIGLFSAITLTDPRVTAWVLLGLMAASILLSMIFENRAFCRYVCPIGGFSGLYAKAAPVELRVIDPGVCAVHQEKDCYTACPWGLYPLSLKDSSACGLCLECLRACPKDNLDIRLRPFGADLSRARPNSHLDEAFLALSMIGCVIVFASVFSGPWGALKIAAFEIGTVRWMGYATGLLTLNLLGLPGLFTVAVWIGQRLSGARSSLRKAVALHTRALVPIGLFAWISFTISFAFPKIEYVLRVMSDPFGWGWNLFGTASSTWALDISAFSPILQSGILLLGLICSGQAANSPTSDGTRPPTRQTLPVLLFCLLFTLVMLWLLIG